MSTLFSTSANKQNVSNINYYCLFKIKNTFNVSINIEAKRKQLNNIKF